MGLTQNQQIFELIKNSRKILIVFKKNFSGDALASSLAIFLLLKKLNKQAEIVCQDFQIPASYKFLPQIDQIKPEIFCLKQFIISLAIGDNKVKNFSYDVKDNLLNIYISPEKGYFEDKNISFKSGDYKYDLIITLDTEDLEALGQSHAQNPDFFYNTPILNIDHHPENELYGQINFVELTKTSTAEIIFDLLEKYDLNLIDQDIATCLLTGMISKTKSFKANSVTPRALNVASQLILSGASRDLIIQNLYRTKSINTLKLWGKVLARLKHDPNYKLAWSYLTQKDFLELNLVNPDLNEVIEELMASAPEAEIVLLLSENDNNKISAILSCSKNYDALYLAKTLKPFGNKRVVTFDVLDSDLVRAGTEVIDIIKQNIK